MPIPAKEKFPLPSVCEVESLTLLVMIGGSRQ